MVATAFEVVKFALTQEGRRAPRSRPNHRPEFRPHATCDTPGNQATDAY
jgi:hypothetical protein